MSDTPDPLALVEEMEALAANATPGPWRSAADSDGPGEHNGVYSIFYVDEEPGVCGNYSKAWPIMDYDSQYIAACSPDRIRSLCEAVRAARKDTERLDWLEMFGQCGIREGEDGGEVAIWKEYVGAVGIGANVRVAIDDAKRNTFFTAPLAASPRGPEP